MMILCSMRIGVFIFEKVVMMIGVHTLRTQNVVIWNVVQEYRRLSESRLELLVIEATYCG